MSWTSSQRVWVITGTSAGLGRELALTILARGDRVVGTARSHGRLTDLEKEYPECFRYLQLDITDTFEAISQVAKEAVAVWGRVDVLINNAGYSIIGTVEESGVSGFFEMYKTNVLGTINVTNAFLPFMRARRSGTIVFIGSRSGWRTGLPTNGLYGSSKAALHGTKLVLYSRQHETTPFAAIADALAEEVRPLDIRVLNVVPGGLRTANINHVHMIPGVPLPTGDTPPKEIPEYATVRGNIREYLDETNGAQSGHPKKAAAVIVDVVRGEGVAQGRPWEGTLFLGSDAVRDVKAKCEATLKALESWGDVARAIDVDGT